MVLLSSEAEESGGFICIASLSSVKGNPRKVVHCRQVKRREREKARDLSGSKVEAVSHQGLDLNSGKSGGIICSKVN